MLFLRRKRQEELQAAETAGKNLWTKKLSSESRYRLVYALTDLNQTFSQMIPMDLYGQNGDFMDEVRYRVVSELGLPSIDDQYRASADVEGGILRKSTEVVLSILEAALAVGQARASSTHGHDHNVLSQALNATQQRIATILREHRVAFDLVGFRFIPYESREMHTKVVVPTLSLLGGDRKYGDVESAYQQALGEISNGSPDDAVTDAARALEAMLAILGCSGNTLGKKLTDARNRGLFGDHDSQLREAMMKVGSWVASDRAETGDAHPGGVATIDDAWLIVHIVGALILRLSHSPSRGGG